MFHLGNLKLISIPPVQMGTGCVNISNETKIHLVMYTSDCIQAVMLGLKRVKPFNIQHNQNKVIEKKSKKKKSKTANRCNNRSTSCHVKELYTYTSDLSLTNYFDLGPSEKNVNPLLPYS